MINTESEKGMKILEMVHQFTRTSFLESRDREGTGE